MITENIQTRHHVTRGTYPAANVALQFICKT